MSSQSEKPSQSPIEERLQTALAASARPLIEHLRGLGEPYYDSIGELTKGIATNGIIILWGTKRYNQDMEDAGKNAVRRPFGIEMDTLSPNTQVVLYPTIIYKPNDEQKKLAKETEYETREGDTQVMVYFTDGFEEEVGNIYDLAANLLFVSHMAGAALNSRYPLEAGEKSPEFQQEARKALGIVREYARAITENQRAKLSPAIARVVSLDEAGLDRETQRFVTYHAEPMKMPGLYEYGQANVVEETPEQAVQNGTLFLHLDERGLPQRVKDNKTEDVPELPWTEYGKNRWNRSHQLFGRYEATYGNESLLVDFRLDSTHMPAKYGFFDTIEIARRTPDGVSQHVILGQEVNREKERLLTLQMFGAKLTDDALEDVVFPIIVAGDFDFTNPQTRELLGKLAADKGTKPDVGRVIADVLRLSAENRLQRVQQAEKEDQQ